MSSVLGSSNGNETGRAITTDPLGNIYVAGVASSFGKHELGEILVSTVRDTNPVKEPLPTDIPSGSSEGAQLESTGKHEGKRLYPSPRPEAKDKESDVILLKFDVHGQTTWIRRFGSENNDVVTSIAYRNGLVYVAGSTYGIFDSKDTPEGTSDAFVMAFREDGESAWPQPLQFGSGGNDSIQSIALDSGTLHGPATCAYIYVAGQVGGNIFRFANQMSQDENQCSCRSEPPVTQKVYNSADQSIPWLKSTLTGRAAELDYDLSSRPSSLTRDSENVRSNETRSSDMFLAKLSADGTIVDAMQIPLQFDNSADAITSTNGKIYIAVNSFNGKPFDPNGSSALLIVCADDMSYRTVYSEASYSRLGDSVHAMAVDGLGNAYLAGLSLQGESGASDYFVRKYGGPRKRFVWETQVGSSSGSIRPLKVSIAYGRLTDQLYVAGHGRGFYETQAFGKDVRRNATQIGLDVFEGNDGTPGSAGPLHGMLRTGLTILSARTGEELITWDKLVPVPSEYEDIQSIALDENENMIFTGRRQSKITSLWDLCLGSFGSHEFSSSSRSSRQYDMGEQSGASADLELSKEKMGMRALTIGLVAVAASITLMSLTAVFVMTRTWIMSRFQVMAPSEGYLYEYQTGELSRFEQNAQRKYAAGVRADNDELFTRVVLSGRSLSNGSGSVVRRSVSRQQQSLDDELRGPGGTVAPM